MTALWYLAEADGTITLNTYDDNVHVRNLRRDQRAALLIDSGDQPYRSVHFNGTVNVSDEAADPEEIGRLYERYLGGIDAATAYGRQLVAGGTPSTSASWLPDGNRAPVPNTGCRGRPAGRGEPAATVARAARLAPAIGLATAFDRRHGAFRAERTHLHAIVVHDARRLDHHLKTRGVTRRSRRV